MESISTFLRGCIWLLWMVFFRPWTFRQRVQQLDRGETRLLIAQTLLTVTLTPILIAVTASLLLPMIGIPFALSGRWTNIAEGVAFGVVGGLAVGIAAGVAFAVGGGVPLGVAAGVAVSVTVGVAAGVTVGVAAGSAVSVPLSVVGGVAVGVAGGAAVSVAVGVAVGVVGGAAVSVAAGVAVGVAFSVAFGVAVGLAGGVVDGVQAGVAMGIGYSVGYFRLVLWPIEALSTLCALARARTRSSAVTQILESSLAYWDELMLLPQPSLTPLLVKAGEQDREDGLAAIVRLATRTFQRREAVKALVELSGRHLLRQRTVESIAHLDQESGWWVPEGTRDHLMEKSGEFRRFREGYQRCLQISANVRAALSATSNYQKLTAFNRAQRQSEDLGKSAVLEMGGRERRVFAQVSQNWSEALRAEIDRLTEEERVTARVPNPYVAPGPLSPGSDLFVGRGEVFRFVEEHFLRAGQNTPIVLHGQPRIGKSSLLRHLTTYLPTNLLPIYVDMQRAAQVESTGGFLYNLADATHRQLTRRDIRLPEPALNDYDIEPFIRFGKFLDAAEDRMREPESRLLLAFDEFEEIEAKLTEGKISRDMMPFLRNMMQHRRGILLLFAGTHMLDEMIEDHWIPFFRSAVPCRVSYLDGASARGLITNPIEDFSLDYAPGAVDLLIERTHRHPCLLQLACSVLVDLKNEQQSRCATVEEAEQALAKTIEIGDFVFRGVWEWIPAAERTLLSVLAGKSQATVDQLIEATGRSRVEVQRMTERLTQTEVVARVSERSNSPVYAFQVQLFQEWVARHTARTGLPVERNR